jgi:hypothetical protein
LENFAPTAATATLLEKFITSSGTDEIDDLAELVTAYSDLTMVRHAAELAVDIGKATGAEKEKLVAKRDAVIKTIQDNGVRDMIPARKAGSC